MVVEDGAARRRRGSVRPLPVRAAAAAASPRARRFEWLSRGIERSLSPTKSSRIIASACLNAAGGDLAAAQAVALELLVGHAARGLLAVEEDEDDGRPQLPGPQRARELDDRRGAGGAVVGADEARDVLRVVVGADDDGAASGSRPGTTPITLRSPPGHGLEAPARQQEPAAARASLPRGGRPGRPRPELRPARAGARKRASRRTDRPALVVGRRLRERGPIRPPPSATAPVRPWPGSDPGHASPGTWASSLIRDEACLRSASLSPSTSPQAVAGV